MWIYHIVSIPFSLYLFTFHHPSTYSIIIWIWTIVKVSVQETLLGHNTLLLSDKRTHSTLFRPFLIILRTPEACNNRQTYFSWSIIKMSAGIFCFPSSIHNVLWPRPVVKIVLLLLFNGEIMFNCFRPLQVFCGFYCKFYEVHKGLVHLMVLVMLMEYNCCIEIGCRR